MFSGNFNYNRVIVSIILIFVLATPVILEFSQEADAATGVGDETIWTWTIPDQVDRVISGDIDNDGQDEVLAMEMNAPDKIYA